MGLFVVGRVLENDFSVAVERHAIVGIGQILGSKPEAQGVFRHEIERPAGSDGGSARRKRDSVEFGDEGEVAHGVFPVLGRKVEVVHRETFLIERGIRALGKRQKYGVHVAHVMAADDVRAVGQSARMFVVSGAEEQRGGIDSTAGNDNHARRVGFG